MQKENEGETVEGINFYRKIFKDIYLFFHRPKKDFCLLCTSFREENEEVKNSLTVFTTNLFVVNTFT